MRSSLSTALLSTLLVMVLSIHSRHVRQINLAFNKQKSAELLDELLADWFSKDDQIPENANGNFPGYPDFYWRTSVFPAQATNPNWPLNKIRVEVVSMASNQVLTRVELATFIESPATRKAN